MLTRERVEELIKKARKGETIKIYFVGSDIHTYTIQPDAELSITGKCLHGLANSRGEVISTLMIEVFLVKESREWFDNYWFAYAHLLRQRSKSCG
jgi:hypothetical protein